LRAEDAPVYGRTQVEVDVGTSASGIAAKDMGSIHAADVGTHNLRKCVTIK
jgi:hypothetical protein